MGFRQPILAGNTLVRDAIQSNPFTAGVTGWRISRNGDAEFHNGMFYGNILIQNNEGVFEYSGTPAAGNLVASFAPVAGVDSFGNSYSAGLSVGAAGAAGVRCGFSGTTGLIFWPNTVPNISLDAKAQSNHQGSGTGQVAFLTLGSAIDATQNDGAYCNLFSSSADGTQNAHATLSYQDPTSAVHSYVQVSALGGLFTGLATGLHPAGGTPYSRSNPAVAETWQNPVFGAGWTTGTFAGGVRSLHYRLDADGYGLIVGTFHSNNAAPAATIFTLPTGYFDPTDIQPIPVITNNAGTFGVNGLQISSAGAVSLVNNLTAANVDVWVTARFRVN